MKRLVLLLPLLALAAAHAEDPATVDTAALWEHIAKSAHASDGQVYPDACLCEGRSADEPTNRVSIRIFHGGLRKPVEALRGVPVESLVAGGFGCCYEPFNLESIRGLDIHRLALGNVVLDGGQDAIAGMRLRTFFLFGSAWTNLADLARMPFLEELQLQCGRVDVSTLGALEHLRVLTLDGEWFGDLSWLARNPVEELSLSFRGSPVRMDLSFLRGRPIRILRLENVEPVDLSFVEGMPLKSLWLENAPVADLSPLKGLALHDLFFDPVAATSGLEVVRSMASLKEIATRSWTWSRESDEADPETFWRRYGNDWFEGGGDEESARPDGEYCDRRSSVRYRIENGEATVLEDISSGRSRTALALPVRLGGAPVVAIAGDAFVYRASLRSVTLPASLRTIGDGAFAGCTALEEVSLPPGLRLIGSDAFALCERLSSVRLPEGLETLGEGAFDGCPFTPSPAASAPYAETAVPRPGEAGPLHEGAAERSEAGGVSHAEGAESESHAENAENAEL